MMMNQTEHSEEIHNLRVMRDLKSKSLSFRCLHDFIDIEKNTIEALKERLEREGEKTIRICLHQRIDDPLHEMLIIHKIGGDFPIHKYANRSGSYHIIEGLLNIEFFNDDGEQIHKVLLGSVDSNLPFMYRVKSNIWYRTYPESLLVIYKETRPGPFQASDTIIFSSNHCSQ